MGNKKLYDVWSQMKHRCTNINYKQFKDYGGRNISVCDDWMNFNTFEKWALKNGYKIGLTIDRIDNEGNYEPCNCQWITRSENSKKIKPRVNMYANVKISIDEASEISEAYETGLFTQKEIASCYNVKQPAISKIIGIHTKGNK